MLKKEGTKIKAVEKRFEDLNPTEAREWFDFFRNLRVFRGWKLESINNLLHYAKLCKFK